MMTYRNEEEAEGVAPHMDPLLELRDEAVSRLEALAASREELITATEGANADDEHDPEGATLAFEREQLAALLRQAQASVKAVDAALDRRAAGTYGRCESCGEDIGAERMAALPAAARCISCGARGR